MSTPRISTIRRTGQTWGRPDRGIQLFGSCREVRGREAQEADRLYGQRFRAYGKWRANLDERDRRMFRYRFFRFVAASIKVLDEAEFGAGVFIVASRRRIA